jgi:crossover junction endodeoxyribonuclease RusA
MFRGRMLISRRGRAYRQAVCSALADTTYHVPEKALAVKIKAYPPDRRKRDVDNIQKPLLDALEKAGIYQNDCQIKLLTTQMLGPVPGGRVVVTIRRINR